MLTDIAAFLLIVKAFMLSFLTLFFKCGESNKVIERISMRRMPDYDFTLQLVSQIKLTQSSLSAKGGTGKCIVSGQKGACLRGYRTLC